MKRKEEKQSDSLSAPEVAGRLRIDVHKVHAWINSGELKAYDLSQDQGTGRPRYRIRLADLESFLENRLVITEESND